MILDQSVFPFLRLDNTSITDGLETAKRGKNTFSI